MMGAVMKHSCLEDNIFLSGKQCDVSPDAGITLEMFGVPELAIERLQQEIWSNVCGARVSLEIQH